MIPFIFVDILVSIEHEFQDTNIINSNFKVFMFWSFKYKVTGMIPLPTFGAEATWLAIIVEVGNAVLALEAPPPVGHRQHDINVNAGEHDIL
ncbi:hypothetical protein FRX31_004972 [Thalictrum thalictroides]|uniref:Uncharacterized protein n=1 Tax=Thalictrum thalictroides TaxID=46969 RepID=A0A7J6X6R7_THATH|nr:hypothetical protein FRX31_004972 [Thalictrum thalictroides]